VTLSAYVGGIGVLGPGLSQWPEAAAVLSGRAAFTPQPTVLPAPTLLPPAERRRTGRVVRLALAVAREAAAHAGVDPATLASVFSSSGGDGHNCHELCEALASACPEVSPTRFSNSVHNAAAGYWSIATAATLESNVLCAFDASFGAGLLEAMTQIAVDGESLLLVAYDTDYPEPIHAKRPVPDAFGVALVLSPQPTAGALARIDVALVLSPQPCAGALARIDGARGGIEAPGSIEARGGVGADTMSNPQLECLRRSIPAARCLPLLKQLARREAGAVVIDYSDWSSIRIEVEPSAVAERPIDVERSGDRR
jgi:hypothetical protein